MDEIFNSLLIENQYVKLAFYLTILFVGPSAYYSLFSYSKKILTLYIPSDTPLTEAEKVRLDRLLESGKRFHNFGFVFAAILIALSSLNNFENFSAPFGEIIFPKLQTSLGLYLLCIILLAVSDRYFLMAYPWVIIDDRRPSYDWIVMGLSFERSRFSGFIFQLPVQIAAIATAIILGSDTSTSEFASFSLLLISGIGLGYLPRSFYFLAHLLDIREDHRGGTVTLSIYLLYWYRMIRQVMYSFYLFLPTVFIIPQWHSKQFYALVFYLTMTVGIAYLIRMFCSSKFIYQRIDKLGIKFGFPATSRNYK